MNQPPQQYGSAPPPPPVYSSGERPCPRCASPDTEKVSYTWWGGLLGPSLFSLRRCRSCRMEFNGKTGDPATKSMTIYIIVTSVITLVLCGGFGFISVLGSILSHGR